MGFELEEIELNNPILNIINKRNIIVGKSNSGKTYAFSNLLFNNLIIKSSVPITFIVLIFTETLNDTNLFYQIDLMTRIYTDKYDIFNDDHTDLQKNKIDEILLFIEKFQLLDNIKNCYIDEIQKNINKMIEQIYEEKIKSKLEKYNIKKINNNERNKIKFNYCGDVNTINKRCDSIFSDKIIKINKEIKILIVLDDICSSNYSLIRQNIIKMFEQGRHKECGITIIDQFFKSTKLEPSCRTAANLILFKALDKNIIDFLKIQFNQKNIDSDNLNYLIESKYNIVYSDSILNKLFYYKTESNFKLKYFF